MESENKKKSTFSAVSINRITAERFRAYSKTVSKSHSETIDTVIDFFEKTKITPRNEVMISFIKFQNYMIGRFNYIEELLRAMEREQIKPTHDLLKSLFEVNASKKNKQPLLVEKGLKKLTSEEWHREEGTISFDKYHKLIEAKANNLRKFREVLSKIEKVEPTFGKAYFKIEIDEIELKALKRELNGN